jgi:hypothetical protein
MFLWKFFVKIYIIKRNQKLYNTLSYLYLSLREMMEQKGYSFKTSEVPILFLNNQNICTYDLNN